MASTQELKHMATQLLSALLANPHIYVSISDEGVHGQQEQELVTLAIAMAQTLSDRIEGQS